MVGKAVNDAIEVGFTHIDCATLYNNEHQIGKDCLKSKLLSSSSHNQISLLRETNCI